MHPYHLKFTMIDDIFDGYGIYFAGILLRTVDHYEYWRAVGQVNRANDIFDMQLRNNNEAR